MTQSWVFAYGSNMDVPDYEGWCTRHDEPREAWKQVEVAELPNFDLRFDYFSEGRGGGAANVVPQAGSRVFGLALLVSARTLATLDRKEDYPHIYDRLKCQVLTRPGQALSCWVYLVRPEHRIEEHVPPTSYYLGLIQRAAERHEFPEWYRKQLDRVPTRE